MYRRLSPFVALFICLAGHALLHVADGFGWLGRLLARLMGVTTDGSEHDRLRFPVFIPVAFAFICAEKAMRERAIDLGIRGGLPIPAHLTHRVRSEAAAMRRASKASIL